MRNTQCKYRLRSSSSWQCSHLVGHLAGQGFWDLNIAIRHQLVATVASAELRSSSPKMLNHVLVFATQNIGSCPESDRQLSVSAICSRPSHMRRTSVRHQSQSGDRLIHYRLSSSSETSRKNATNPCSEKSGVPARPLRRGHLARHAERRCIFGQ